VVPAADLAAARGELRRALRRRPVRAVEVRLRIAGRVHCHIALALADGRTLESAVVDVDPQVALKRGVARAIGVAERAVGLGLAIGRGA
jgi:hypothetical protein